MKSGKIQKKKSGKIPAKYGIPKIRAERHLSRFSSDSGHLRPVFRTVSKFSRKYENGRVKCRIMAEVYDYFLLVLG